eukprot:15337452-Alexandrium_andersonii.AAC.1
MPGPLCWRGALRTPRNTGLCYACPFRAVGPRPRYQQLSPRWPGGRGGACWAGFPRPVPGELPESVALAC